MLARGFTLLEVVIALSLVCVALLAVAPLFASSVEGMAAARRQTLSVLLASARLEQLRALTFVWDEEDRPITDVSTDLSMEHPRAGGSGLAPAGADSLRSSIAGFVDYLDGQGRWVGNDPSPPADAAFVRRWSIDRFGGSSDVLVLQVLVRPVSQGLADAVRQGRSETRLTSIRSRMRR
jgi:prepilin-type N-terminal cleavage/methylation domain-containing protein